MKSRLCGLDSVRRWKRPVARVSPPTDTRFHTTTSRDIRQYGGDVRTAEIRISSCRITSARVSRTTTTTNQSNVVDTQNGNNTRPIVTARTTRVAFTCVRFVFVKRRAADILNRCVTRSAVMSGNVFLFKRKLLC